MINISKFLVILEPHHIELDLSNVKKKPLIYFYGFYSK